MVKALVLGGNGFIGTNLVRKLADNNFKVRSFDLSMPDKRYDNVEYVSGDFFDKDTLKKAVEDIDVIYHGICTLNPGNSEQCYMRGYEKDFVQSIYLCELAKENGIKLIFLSSGGTVYGAQKVFPIDESVCTNPINHYGSLKACIENVIQVFDVQNAAKMLIARIANPYGPGQDYRKGVGFIDAVIKRGLANETVEIWGDGEIVRDYIYIDDVTDMLIALYSYDGHHTVFNLSSSYGSSQKDIVNIVSKWIPDLKVTYKAARKVDVNKLILSNERIKKIYRKDLVDIEKGIGNYIKYIKNNYSEE